MNEVKIQIPDNCELIKDGDTYIVKEKKQTPPRSWEEFCEKYPRTVSEYFIRDNSNIRQICETIYPRNAEYDKNICTSKEEAEAFLALMQLRQLRKAWVGDWEQSKEKFCAAILCTAFLDKVVVHYAEFWTNVVLSFPTKEMADDFLNCFRDLCETAKILL